METHLRSQDLGAAPVLSRLSALCGLCGPWVRQPFPVLSALTSPQAPSGSQDGSKLTIWGKGLSNFILLTSRPILP